MLKPLEFIKKVRFNVAGWTPSIFDETGDVRVRDVVKWLLDACDEIEQLQGELNKEKSRLDYPHKEIEQLQAQLTQKITCPACCHEFKREGK